MSLQGPFDTLDEAREAVDTSSGCVTAFIDPCDGKVYLIVDPEPKDIEEIVDAIFMAFDILEERRAE